MFKFFKYFTSNLALTWRVTNNNYTDTTQTYSSINDCPQLQISSSNKQDTHLFEHLTPPSLILTLKCNKPNFSLESTIGLMLLTVNQLQSILLTETDESIVVFLSINNKFQLRAVQVSCFTTLPDK